MSYTLLDVLPEEAHRKEILRQAEARRLANRALRPQAYERKSPGAIRLTIGRWLIGLGRKLQNQPGPRGNNADVAFGLK
jgi:hypothetical protein